MLTQYLGIDGSLITKYTSYYQSGFVLVSVGSTSSRIQRKEDDSDTKEKLCQKFEKEFKELMKHQYRTISQYCAARKLKQEIGDAECVVQCDFSENYYYKLGEETMSMHFGASKQQISLHTCHVTLRNETRCFCTASLDTRHMAPSILAHLEPVLTDLQKHGVQKLHVVSDGPTSEYRNNSNFQLLANIPYIVAGPGIGGKHDR